MSIADIIIVVAIAAAFTLVVLRLRKKGACAGCASAGSCGGACSSCSPARQKSCPAVQGADEIAERLGKNVRTR